jgi:hypothetical protein
MISGQFHPDSSLEEGAPLDRVGGGEDELLSRDTNVLLLQNRYRLSSAPRLQPPGEAALLNGKDRSANQRDTPLNLLPVESIRPASRDIDLHLSPRNQDRQDEAFPKDPASVTRAFQAGRSLNRALSLQSQLARAFRPRATSLETPGPEGNDGANIQVTIGRVEVRAVSQAAAPARQSRSPAPQPSGLEEYLRRPKKRW